MKEDRQIVWDEHEYHGQKYYYGFYKGTETKDDLQNTFKVGIF